MEFINRSIDGLKLLEKRRAGQRYSGSEKHVNFSPVPELSEASATFFQATTAMTIWAHPTVNFPFLGQPEIRLLI